MVRVKEAIILAGGLGTRLLANGISRPKPLVRIKGIPLILYPVLTLKSVGIRKFTIVASRSTFTPLKRLLKEIDASFEFILNPHVERENGYSFTLAIKRIESEAFLLSMSDHLYTRSIPRKLIETSRTMRKWHILIAGDRRPGYIDVDEATKILADEEGSVKAIGKGLEYFTHIDTGVFLVRKSVEEITDLLEKTKYTIKFSDIITKAIDLGYRVKVVDVTGYPWTEIDTVEDLVDAHYGRRSIVTDVVSSEIGEIAWIPE